MASLYSKHRREGMTVGGGKGRENLQNRKQTYTFGIFLLVFRFQPNNFLS